MMHSCIMIYTYWTPLNVFIWGFEPGIRLNTPTVKTRAYNYNASSDLQCTFTVIK